jgi:sugar lactone lactonase YvrE
VRVFNAEPGGTDGIRVDVHGNLWCGFSGGETEDGVAVFAPDGKMIGRILLPERCANVCFGGRKRNRACSWRRASRSTRSMSRLRVLLVGNWSHVRSRGCLSRNRDAPDLMESRQTEDEPRAG